MQQQQQAQFLEQQKNYYQQKGRNSKKYKKVVYKEESESEPELEQEEDEEFENELEKEHETKKTKVKRKGTAGSKNNIFDCINKNAKRQAIEILWATCSIPSTTRDDPLPLIEPPLTTMMLKKKCKKYAILSTWENTMQI